MNIFLDANICLDLLDTTRPTSKKSVQWYMNHKDNLEDTFFFSGDFITTFFYILTQKRKYNPKDTLIAIDSLSSEIKPHFINQKDFNLSKNQFFDNYFEDFEDLIILNSAIRIKCEKFVTNDKELISLSKHFNMKIEPL